LPQHLETIYSSAKRRVIFIVHVIPCLTKRMSKTFANNVHASN
jgi:hypothetical protein